MKVLVISSAALPTPPPDYGGLEVVTAGFAISAAQKGHEITLVSAEGSSLAGRDWHFQGGGSLRILETINPTWQSEEAHYQKYVKLLEEEFSDGKSIVWDNTWEMRAYKSAAKFPKMAILHTHHGNQSFQTPPPNVWFPRMMGVSAPQAYDLSQGIGVPFRYVWNGITLPAKSEITGKTNKGFLLSLNRISRFKGIHLAMDLAVKSRTPMIIVGDDTKVEDQAYAFRCVERARRSNGLIKYYGLVDSATKTELLKTCKAMVACPVERGPNGEKYIEAFGLNVVEANAYGKPVLCLANGGHKDTVQPGVNGFLAKDPDELQSYVSKLDDIKPEDCRRIVEEKFTADVMTDSYLSIFERILANDDAFVW